MYPSITYVFSGGGSGGHLFPALAVAEEIRARDPRAGIVFAGSMRGVEREIVCTHGYRHESLPVEPSTMLRRNPLRFLWRHWRARRQAGELLEECRPAAVIGLGGFASVPVVLAASARRIPVLLLEQNIVPGRATRWLSGSASAVCLSFEQTRVSLAANLPTHVTGNPVSRRIASLRDRSSPDDPRDRPTLLVLGGSQGAIAVNEMVLAAIERLQPQARSDRIHAVQPVAPRPEPDGSGHYEPRRPDESGLYNPFCPIVGWHVVHQTGAAQHGDVVRRYEEWEIAAAAAPFFSDMAMRYSRATLAVTRGGATSLAELAVAGVPAIIVPYPNSLGDHQRLNARYYEAQGAARVVEQGGDAVSAMTRALSELTTEAGTLRRMGAAMRALAMPQAAAAVVEQLLQLSTERVLQQRRSA